jgi:hypothetical protein
MAMHDILHNASVASLDFILGRQEGLGGIDLRQVSKSNERYDYPFLAERVEFMQDFYNYVCLAKPGGFKLKWSDWVIENSMQA